MFNMFPAPIVHHRLNSLARSSVTPFLKEVNRVFDDFLPSYASELGDFDVDIRDDGESLLVTADLPGVQKNELNVTVDGKILTISCERKKESDTKRGDYRLQERHYGAMSRSFTLPSSVNESKIDATLKEGVLFLTIPKLEGSKGRKVEIRSG